MKLNLPKTRTIILYDYTHKKSLWFQNPLENHVQMQFTLLNI